MSRNKAEEKRKKHGSGCPWGSGNVENLSTAHLKALRDQLFRQNPDSRYLGIVTAVLTKRDEMAEKAKALAPFLKKRPANPKPEPVAKEEPAKVKKTRAPRKKKIVESGEKAPETSAPEESPDVDGATYWEARQAMARVAKEVDAIKEILLDIGRAVASDFSIIVVTELDIIGGSFEDPDDEVKAPYAATILRIVNATPDNIAKFLEKESSGGISEELRQRIRNLNFMLKTCRDYLYNIK